MAGGARSVSRPNRASSLSRISPWVGILALLPYRGWRRGSSRSADAPAAPLPVGSSPVSLLRRKAPYRGRLSGPPPALSTSASSSFCSGLGDLASCLTLRPNSYASRPPRAPPASVAQARSRPRPPLFRGGARAGGGARELWGILWATPGSWLSAANCDAGRVEREVGCCRVILNSPRAPTEEKRSLKSALSGAAQAMSTSGVGDPRTAAIDNSSDFASFSLLCICLQTATAHQHQRGASRTEASAKPGHASRTQGL